MKKRPLVIITVLICLLSTMRGQISFDLNSGYSYLKGSQASTLSENWMNPEFNISAWSVGSAPFRYGDGVGGTVLGDMQNTYSSVYLKSSFEAVNVHTIDELSLKLNYDDGFILWINGEEILSRNAPEFPSFNGLAPENHESGILESVNISTSGIPLNEGTNVIAVQAFNISLGSSDFYFDMALDAQAALPKLDDSLEVLFSYEAGFYSSAFNLEVYAPDDSYKIKYTTDGSNPQTSSTATITNQPARINVNPLSADKRALTPAFVVRASLYTEGFQASIPDARTYIFTDRVLKQGHPGGSWPTNNVNGQELDFAMDPRVTESAGYGPQMVDALKDIPSLCISTDVENLFGSGEGIYVNADQRGIEWERFCSVELISSNATEGFSVNGGLRIRGGWSRHDEFPKHAFRLFFRSDYGDSKLHYPLFGDEGVDQFDKIDLRTAQNYSWSRGLSNNTFAREVFCRDTQGAMGQPYTRSRYYHLYLNGMYWGLYQTQERAEARFASDYFGGEKNDYDVIKVNGENYQNQVEATDGVIDRWEDILQRCETGFLGNRHYFDLIGRNEHGDPKKGSEILVDIDNLIDYMLNIFYSGNFDAPVTKFGGEKKANNFYAINKRDDKSKGFVFFVHDAEHSLMTEAHRPGIGLEENRVTLPGMEVSDISRFHPQWLHQKLSANKEYKMRFADRVQKHFLDKGVFTKDEALKRFNNRTRQIEKAIIAESARWGDGRNSALKTKDNDWLPETNKVRNVFFPRRPAIVLQQLKDAGLFPVSVAAPYIQNNSVNLQTEHINLSETQGLSFVNPKSYGTIYVTKDGSDPRKVGGAVNPDAMSMNNGSALSITKTTVIKSRVLYNGVWSALREYHFVADKENYQDLKITELHYYPPDSIVGTDTISGKGFEFLELKNTGDHALNLSWLELDSAVKYTFPEHTLLPPNEFYVIATKPKWFYERYGLVPSGNCERFLSNEGEEFILETPSGERVLHFFYTADAPWPAEAAGQGFSLTAADLSPVRNPNDFLYWRPSSVVGGTPFADDLSVINPNTSIEASSAGVKVFPNPSRGVLNVVDNSDNQWIDMIQIYTANGQLMTSYAMNGTLRVDLSSQGIAEGLLLVKAIGNGKSEVVKLLYQP